MMKMMKMMKKLLLMMLTVFAFIGCDEGNGDDKSTITVPNKAELTQKVYADQTTGKSGVTFATEGAWSSSIAVATGKAEQTIAPDWIKISPESGDKAGEYTIKITLGTNFTGATRTATITIVSGKDKITITITQEATTEKGDVPEDGENPDATDGMVKKINGEIVEYGEVGDIPYATKIGEKEVLTKAYSLETWVYVQDFHNTGTSHYNYGNDRKLLNVRYEVRGGGRFNAECLWSGSSLSEIRGDQVGVSRTGYLRTEIEYGDTEYTKGNVDINWLLASSEYFTVQPISSIVVKTTRDNKLLTKKIQTEEQGDGKYDATITYRYVFNTAGYITEIHETRVFKMDGAQPERKIYELEY